VGKVARAALIEYLGREADPPRDLVAWVTDVDLADPARDSLDVRVLLERRDLGDLIEVLDGLIKGARRTSMLSEADFFSTLQTVVTGATLDRMAGLGSAESAIRSASAISDLLPRWVNTLPYKSSLQRTTFDDFTRMNPNERANFEAELEAKLRLYRDYNNDKDIWHALSPRHSDLQHVYPMRLSDLP
jgi:hypothetical protein